MRSTGRGFQVEGPALKNGLYLLPDAQARASSQKTRPTATRGHSAQTRNRLTGCVLGTITLNMKTRFALNPPKGPAFCREQQRHPMVCHQGWLGPTWCPVLYLRCDQVV